MIPRTIIQVFFLFFKPCLILPISIHYRRHSHWLYFISILNRFNSTSSHIHHHWFWTLPKLFVLFLFMGVGYVRQKSLFLRWVKVLLVSETPMILFWFEIMNVCLMTLPQWISTIYWISIIVSLKIISILGHLSRFILFLRAGLLLILKWTMLISFIKILIYIMLPLS